MIIFGHRAQSPNWLFGSIINFFLMSKQAKEQKSVTPTTKTPEQTVVQKVVNQRYTNGKRQFKVIWLGRPFQQATWVDEQKLNCPQKIAEFLKRYQQVMRKKNLQSKIQPDAYSFPSSMKVQSVPKPQPKKMTLEKPDNGTQQKLIISQPANLNKQKLQASLHKNNLITRIKNPQTESTIPTLNVIKNDTPSYKRQTEPQIENYSNITRKNSNETAPKSQKISENDHQDINGVGKPKNKSTRTTRRLEFADELEEDTAETDEQFSLCGQQQTFMDITERLEIENISGMILDFEGKDLKKSIDLFLSQKNGKIQIPTFFLVKNKFSNEQKLIPRERMINQQPHKLIWYYETLISESQQQKA